MKKVSRVQMLAFVYSFLLLVVVAMNYIPSIHDENGLMFGLFKLDPIDDALHLGSAIWACLAALHSKNAVLFYFRWFGLAYFMDGVLGLLIGKGYLDLGIFLQPLAVADWSTRLGLNIPHLMIGGSAMLIGFVLSKKKFLKA